MTTREFDYTNEASLDKATLGKLVGPCANFIVPTRNDRLYDEELWEHVFNDPIVKEQIDAGGIFGEIQHPTDGRLEVDPEKIAIGLKELPEKHSDGRLYATFYIMNTPCGRILKTLCDFGYKIGVSSRGDGETTTTDEGEKVVPDTYDFVTFDTVFVPAVKEARMTYIAESKQREQKKSLRKALNEAIEKTTDPDEQRIMKEEVASLSQALEIDTDKTPTAEKQAQEKATETNKDNTTDNNDGDNLIQAKVESKEVGDSKSDDEKTNDKSDDKSDDKTKTLLSTLLKENAQLKALIRELQEKLSVGYSKELTQEESIERQNKTISKLTENVKRYEHIVRSNATLNQANETLTKDLNSAREEIKALKESVARQNKTAQSYKTQTTNLSEALNVKAMRQLEAENALKETQSELQNSKREVVRLSESLSRSNKELKAVQTESANRVQSLTEALENIKKDKELMKETYNSKLAKLEALTRRYQTIADESITRYIRSKALALNLNENEIRNKLPKKYTFDDIDTLCEDLRQYSLNISSLPFDVSHVKLKPKENTLTDDLAKPSDADEIDESLLRFLNK